MKIDDPRTQNQIWAALKLWRLLAEHSQTHPSRHPGIEEMFKHFPPLTMKQIDEVLATHEAPRVPLLTVTTFAEQMGVSSSCIRYALVRLHAKPSMMDGKAKLYPVITLHQALTESRNR